MDTISQFLRWLATCKWDLFIWEPPSELITQIEKQPPIPEYCTDGQSLAGTENWQVILGTQLWINNSTQMVNIPLCNSPEESRNKYWWGHLVDNFSTQNWLSYLTLEPNTTSPNPTDNSASYTHSSKNPCKSQVLKQQSHISSRTPTRMCANHLCYVVAQRKKSLKKNKDVTQWHW